MLSSSTGGPDEGGNAGHDRRSTPTIVSSRFQGEDELTAQLPKKGSGTRADARHLVRPARRKILKQDVPVRPNADDVERRRSGLGNMGRAQIVLSALTKAFDNLATGRGSQTRGCSGSVKRPTVARLAVSPFLRSAGGLKPTAC